MPVLGVMLGGGGKADGVRGVAGIDIFTDFESWRVFGANADRLYRETREKAVCGTGATVYRGA